MSGRIGVEARAAVVRQALRNPQLRRVLAAYLMFNVAEWATWIALLVWGYDAGGVRGSSEIALVQLVPGAFLAAPAASLCGRLPRGRALCVGYAAQATGFLALGGVLVGGLPVVVVGAVAGVSAITISLTRPVHNALLPEISQTTGELTAGNAASGALEAVGTFVGPLTSGLVLAAWGAGGVLLVMGATALVAALLTLRLVSAAPTGTAWRTREARTGGAFRTVLRHPAARLMAVLVAAEYALVGMMDILLVVLALRVLNMSDSGPGVLNSAIGVGGLAGAGLTLTLIGRQRLATPLVLGALGAGISFALTGLATAPAVALLLVAASGAGKLFYDVASRTFVQRLLPDHLLTAMFGVQESLTMTGLALGTLAAPVLVVAVGPRSAFLVAGCFLPAISLASYRLLRRMDVVAAVPVDGLALLMKVPILAVLAPRIVERMARDAVAERVPAGETIVRQGDLGNRFYVIASGTLSVDIDGVVIRELGPGEWFGEIALLRDVPRTATVTALTEASVWAMDRDSFLPSVAAASRSVEVAETHIRDTYL